MAKNPEGQTWLQRLGQNIGALAGHHDMGPAEKPQSKQTDTDVGQEFGETKPAKIAEQLTKEQLLAYRDKPEQFGLSEAEKQAAADKAAAASGAQAATALTQAAREMKGGGMTGYASQAMREATEPGSQAAATASQQALQQSRQMIEEKGTALYNQLLGLPARAPTVWEKAAAGAGSELLASGAEMGLEYMDQNLLGDPADAKGDYHYTGPKKE